MCGISGFVNERSDVSRDQLHACVKAMSDALAHRGPDGDGFWFDGEAGVALGHRRLAVVELSMAGDQPFISADGRFVLIYNGEVYNTAELKAEISAARDIRFRGHSDTEAVAEGFALWGVEQTVKKMIGMFAFAAWDRWERVLYLGRDRLGIKPLYWGKPGSAFMFGSELKALRALPGWTPELDGNALATFLRHNSVSGPRSIYRGISQLTPGTILKWKRGGQPEITPFWSLGDVVRQARRSPFPGNEADATEALHDLLLDAVRRRLISDVPLGAFLSGGIDSSLVVALMQAVGSQPVHTFTIGFYEKAFDEVPYAREVSQHLGTHHTELYVSERDALDVIPRLVDIYDEPFADSSQIPTYLISRMARQHVTVALSGDGGDELLAGYTRYFQAERVMALMRRVPQFARQGIAAGLDVVPSAVWGGIARMMPVATKLTGNRAHKLASLLREGPDGFYLRMISHWTDTSDLLHLETGDSGGARMNYPENLTDEIARMQFTDMLNYLPNDILTKVDRASMAVALEARVPLLDHRLVAFAWSLPAHMKTRDGTGKWLLQRVLNRYVPKHLVERPKMGFGIPLGDWLRGALRDWCEDLLSERALQRDGIFNPAPIRAKWNEHCAGTANWQYLLWDILMFQAWKRRWMP